MCNTCLIKSTAYHLVGLYEKCTGTAVPAFLLFVVADAQLFPIKHLFNLDRDLDCATNLFHPVMWKRIRNEQRATRWVSTDVCTEQKQNNFANLHPTSEFHLQMKPPYKFRSGTKLFQKCI